jgi:uncharacterized membrane protein YqjE
MPSSPTSLGEALALAKRLLMHALAIGHGRVELLLVELQEERERVVLALLLAVGAAAFGLLGGIALTLLLVVLTWKFSPVATLAVLCLLYFSVSGFLYLRLAKLRKDWKTLPATADQFQKDRTCLENILR